jgi:hypothetical protein
MEIERQYVSFKQAEKLKDKGFNVYCQYRYTDFNGNIELEEDASEIFPYTPEHWQVIEWLRINHNIWIYTRPVLDEDGEWMFKCYVKLMNAHKAKEYQTALERKPEESISRAIDYVLEKLI